jgi:hypothetical protein
MGMICLLLQCFCTHGSTRRTSMGGLNVSEVDGIWCQVHHSATSGSPASCAVPESFQLLQYGSCLLSLSNGDQQMPSPHPQHTGSPSSCHRHPWAGWQPMRCFCAVPPRGTRGTGEGRSPHNLQGNRGRTARQLTPDMGVPEGACMRLICACMGAC